jgi:hypothetical protein
VNSFEIAILRMVVKLQKPVSIPYLVGGFPNNSEDSVLWAIDNLLKLGFISYTYNEKRDYIIYNKEKRKEILKIIDPLPDLESETETGQLFSVPKKEAKQQPFLATGRKSSNNKRSCYLHKSHYLANIALGTSILAIGVVILFGSTIPTSNVYRHFGLFGAYYSHHNSFPFYSMDLYYDPLTNHSPYNSQYLKAEETISDNNGVFLYMPHKSPNNCNV